MKCYVYTVSSILGVCELLFLLPPSKLRVPGSIHVNSIADYSVYTERSVPIISTTAKCKLNAKLIEGGSICVQKS